MGGPRPPSTPSLYSSLSPIQEQIRPPSFDFSRYGDHIHEPEATAQAAASPAALAQPVFRLIQHLHRQACIALKKIESYSTESRSLGTVTSKLERWSELFDGQLALDLMLLKRDADGKELVYAELRQAVITVLVDIILTEEFILTELSKDGSRPDLERTPVDTVSSLAVQDARDIATSRPVSIPESADISELLLKNGRGELEAAVDDLYKLLPTIRMLRRGTMLDWEEEAAEEERKRAQRETVMRTASKESGAIDSFETRELLETMLDSWPSSSARDLTEGGDNNVKSEEGIPETAARLARKQLEVLREYKTVHAATLLGEDKEAADRLLREFIRDEARMIEGGEKSAVSRGKNPDTGTSTSVDRGKELSEKQRLDFESRISELVDQLPRSHT
ncbi:hypothetical protein B0T24DRAFT_122199 [Lasiosphaeria ovina]|uniref:Uncharacterized protein n=1 Tax=Lasiosphaeria ovina TaxID=92902 RepID=A0AAE0JSN6_9PEZI|nr:hypothetical protein B0T24DRAFT_122199 [Lasiosphaeria ovina]